jgi:hypothetical protein
MEKTKHIGMMNKIFTELNKCVILITVTCTLFSCKKQKNNDLDLWKESRLTGFLLEEYKINDWKLDSITVDFVKWQKRTNHNLDKRIPTMYILACPDSMNCVINDKNGKKKYIDVLAYPPDTYYFAFIGEYKTDHIRSFIFKSLGIKVFGYATYDGMDVVLLTNINDEYCFERIFNGMFKATGREKHIKDFYFPEKGTSGIYDPVYLMYKMENGKMSIPVWTMDFTATMRDKDDSTWKWN